MTEQNGHKADRTFTCRIPEDQAELTGLVARVNGQSVNALVRDAIAARIEELRSDAEFQRRLKESIERDRGVLERLAALSDGSQTADREEP